MPDDAPANPAHVPRGRGGYVRVRPALRYAIFGLFWLAAGYTVYFAADLLLPVVFAGFLAFLFYPAVALLNRVGLPDWAGATTVMLLLAGVVVGGVQVLATPATEWVQRAPDILQQVQYRIWPVKRALEGATETSEKISEMTDVDRSKAMSVVIQEPSLAQRILSHTWRTAAQFVMTLALLFFLLAEGRRTVERLLSRVDPPARQARLYAAIRLVQRRTAAYLGTVAVIQSGVGLLTALALYAYGLPNPFLWGALATLLGFMPYIGPVMTTAMIALVSLTTQEGWFAILAPPLTYVVITTIEGYVVTPAVLGRRLTLNPIAIFLSMLFWTWVWGLPGAILSVPILAAATIVATEARRMGRSAEAEVPAATATAPAVSP